MGWKEADEVVVYWYRLKEHVDIHSQGYVGVTSRQKQRHWQHTSWIGSSCLILRRAFEKYGEDLILKDVVFKGTREECLLKEIELRPTAPIGWNAVAGGGVTPDCTGRVHSDETKAKIGRGNKGKNLGRVSPFKGVTGRYSESTLEAIGVAHRGKTISEEHKESCRQKLSGSKHVYARHIVLCHVDSPDVEHYYGSIGEAAVVTGVSRPALKSTVSNRRTTYNRKGWRVLFEKSHPELGQQ